MYWYFQNAAQEWSAVFIK